MADIIQIRRDTAANWGTADPVLAQGEFAWALDTNTLKLGDGTTVYSLLPTFSGSIEAQDDGVSIVSAMTFNFTGAGITVTDVGGVATINVPAPPGAPVDSVFGRVGAVTAQNGDYTAGQITYVNTGSGLVAITVQGAIDEIDTRVDALEALPGAPVDSVFGRAGTVVAVAGDYTGGQISYSNASSGMVAANVQAAIDEVEARVDTLEAAPAAPVDSVHGRTGAVVSVAGDYDADQVDYDNTTSGLAATDTQEAIDEVEGRVDALEALPAPPVDSVFGRTGVVVAQASDYDANQIDFDDSGVPVTAADVQDAIEQLYARVGVFESFNTDTTTNLNTAGLTQVPIFGTITQAGPAGYFTVGGNLLTVNVAMRIKVSSNVSYTATSNRVNAAIGASLNGTITGATGRSGYIRNNNGHNESSVHMSTILDCAIGDQIGLFSQQQAAGGATTMIVARSNYIVEIMELL